MSSKARYLVTFSMSGWKDDGSAVRLMARRKHDDGDVGRGLMWRQGHRDLQGTE